MPSKIHRREDLAAIAGSLQAVDWQLVGGGSTGGRARPASCSAPGQLAGQNSGQRDTSASLELEWELRVAQAREQGRAEGEAAGGRAAATRLDPALSGFQALIQGLTTQRERLRAGAEEDVVKLAIAIARRVLNRELSTDPGAILGLVKVAFEKLNARETHRLRLAPSDAVLVEQHRGKLAFPQALEISADATLEAGGAVFETSRGEVDASTQTQLGEIERGLYEVLRQHTK